MPPVPLLIYDLALILTAAGFTTLLFRRLHQPVVLGYLVAGFTLSPHFTWAPSIADESNIRIWAEIGVVFLLFALGLEFSFKRLARVGGSSFVTAFLEVAFMTLIGFVCGLLLGWNTMDAIFLGGVLSISSTTIIAKAFDEAGVKGRSFVQLVYGILIVEDLIAILLLVILSTLALSHTVSGADLAFSLTKFIFFLTMWFLSGIFIVPSLLKRVRPLLNEETLLIFSVSLCLVMVVLATKAGFSAALGAFIMGSILGETNDAERIGALIKPVKDLFAAIFFVSVGMLLDPQALFTYSNEIVLISLVLVAGKVLSTVIGTLLSGHPLRQGIQAGFSLSNIGEFSFIIAGLGLTLNVIGAKLYAIAVGVSALTTFATPYFIRSADKVATAIESWLPGKWHHMIYTYHQHRRFKAVSGFRELWQVYFARIFFNVVITAGIFLAIENYLSPTLHSQIENTKVANGIGLGIALLLSAPFLWAITMTKPRLGPNLIKRTLGRKFRAPLLLFALSRWLIVVILFGVLSTRFITPRVALFTSLSLAVLIFVAFSRYLNLIYQWIETQFKRNLEEKEEAFVRNHPPIAPWDAHLSQIIVSPDSMMSGQSLEALKIRERFGVTIALIERGELKIPAPKRTESLYPFDKISVLGTDEQIMHFQAAVQRKIPASVVSEGHKPYQLKPVLISEKSPFCSRSIRESGIREKSHGLVVGVERRGRRILNPDSSMKIEPGDLLWIVGDSDLLRTL